MGPAGLRGYFQKKTTVYLKSTFFQLLVILKNVLFRHLNRINRHTFVSKTKSKTVFMKKIQSPQKLFQKHDNEMRYEIYFYLFFILFYFLHNATLNPSTYLAGGT
jgi:hypothetical protein